MQGDLGGEHMDLDALKWADGSFTPAGLAQAPVSEIVKNPDNFFRAVTDGSVRTVQAFVEHHPDCVHWTMDRQGAPYESYRGGTGLSGAGIWGTREIADILIRAGADMDFQDKDGNTPLHNAIKYQNGKMGEYFVRQNASIDIQNNNGNSARSVMNQLNPEGAVYKALAERAPADKPLQHSSQSRVAPASLKDRFEVSGSGDVHISLENVGGQSVEIKGIKTEGDFVITGGSPGNKSPKM